MLRLLGCLLLGALLPLAFAPYGLWPLAILLPAVLLGPLHSARSLREIFVLGFAFGLGYFAFGVYWIYNSLHDFGMAPPVVAGGITGLLVIVLALFPALVFAFWWYSRQRFGAVTLWLLPAYWFGMEWLKGWFATGLPWLSLGYSQTASPLAGFAPLVGVYGIGALCMLMAVALYLCVRDRRYVLLSIPPAIFLAGWLLQQLEWTEEQAQALRVTMVQGNIPQEVKWRYEQRQNIFNTYWRETSRNWDSDLIVWPETALPGDSEEIETSVLQPMQAAAREHGSSLLTGLVVGDSKNNRFYNSVVLLGAERGYYHKRHLVLFGEYYPMRWLLDLFSGLINIPYSDLTHGPREQPLLEVDGNVLGVSICFEDVFSRQIMLALPQATLLVNVSNDAWFGNSSAPHQHLQIAQMRAQETERVMIRSTNTGVSAFIDHKGRIIDQTRQFATESISASVYGRSGATPFYWFEKVQAWLAILPFIVVLLLARRNTG